MRQEKVAIYLSKVTLLLKTMEIPSQALMHYVKQENRAGEFMGMVPVITIHFTFDHTAESFDPSKHLYYFAALPENLSDIQELAQYIPIHGVRGDGINEPITPYEIDDSLALAFKRLAWRRKNGVIDNFLDAVLLSDEEVGLILEKKELHEKLSMLCTKLNKKQGKI